MSHAVDVEPADETATPEAAPATLAPVASPERVQAVDTLRGVALLGILAMNIVAFAWPFSAYESPLVAGTHSAWDWAEWIVATLVFDTKMMTLFSMLFGAGLVLMTERSDARGVPLRGLYYRRVLWLLAFGLVHSYGFWAGDILYHYAACGLLLYPFRRKSPRVLLALALLVLMVPLPIGMAVGSFFSSAERASARVVAAKAEGREAAPDDKELASVWESARSQFRPTPADTAEEIATHRGGYVRIARDRAGSVFFMQTALFVLVLSWEVGGRMLLGMALMKWGIFSATRPASTYRAMALVGYGLGLPLVALGAYRGYRHGFDSLDEMGVGGLPAYFGNPMVALGHVGAIMLIVQAGALPGLTRRLAAVGRMALSHYLFDTVFCCLLFEGYGLGLFGRIDRAGLALIVAAIWAWQLWISPIWLSRFRFGPAEWLWRSLTYWKLQPMRVAA